MTVTPAPAASAASPHPVDRDLPDFPDLPPLPDTAPRAARALHRALTELRAALQGWPHRRADLAEWYAEAAKMLADLPTVPPATTVIDGKVYWREDDGRMTPASLVKRERLLEDELVRRIAAGALGVSAILGRFAGYSMSEAAAYQETLAQSYGADGKAQGNVSYYSFDRSWKVTTTRADKIDFGPEIQVARTLLLEFVREQGGSDALKALVNSALGLDREGVIRKAELLRLRSYDIDDPKWMLAMQAITASIRSGGTAEYLRVYRRSETGRYELVPLDLASVLGRAA